MARKYLTTVNGNEDYKIEIKSYGKLSDFELCKIGVIVNILDRLVKGHNDEREQSLE